MIENLLLQVHKPGRYIAQEWNMSRKDLTQAKIKFALGFPDIYEVGMSNLGIRILYDILNKIPDLACERFFAPAADMQEILRKNQADMFTLESSKPLREFDIIGFSLGSELDYTNVLSVLELARIPFLAAERNNDFPLLIAGGPCTLNPEPMHAFFDLFIIGEAEEAVVEVIDLYRLLKTGAQDSEISKRDLLFQLAQIEGVYVPSFYQEEYDEGGRLKEFKPVLNSIPAKVKKRFVRDLDNFPFPVKWLVPFIQIVHDRLTLEIMRGCPNKCRFCQARSQYYPLRLRSADKILEIAEQGYCHTGYEEISLAGLSVSDYPGISGLLTQLSRVFKPRSVNLSLPSIKARKEVGAISAEIAMVKKTGLTFAPEAGSKRLRELMAKNFDEDEFFQVLVEAFIAGYQRVKLYFMIGLPFEKDEDLDAIVELAIKVSELRRKTSSRSAQVNLSINTLIPKPHTSLQWFAMSPLTSIKAKQERIRNMARTKKKLELNFHALEMSYLEGILSRGDRRLSKVILSAYEKGARFDAWQEHFAFGKWEEAFNEEGINPDDYLRERNPEEMLPWDFLDVGISKESLRDEFDKLIAI